MTDPKPIGDRARDGEIVLSIIISCCNTRDLVSDCLRSIYQNPTAEPYEILLVRSEINRHYAHSNNWALDQARGRYVLLLNNDTLVLPRALDDMIAFLREYPDAGAVGCKLL